VLERLARELAEKIRAERERQRLAEAERVAKFENEKAEVQKNLDGPIDCYRVILRRWEKKDSKDFAEFVERVLTTHSEHCINNMAQNDTPKLEDYIKDKTKWAVELKDGGKVVGGFSFEIHNGNETERNIIHTMDEKHTGGGYTTEATKGLVNFGFEVMGLSAIYTSLCETNVGGLKVVNACGFKFDSVSTHKQACRFDSKLHSSKYFSITADEWKQFKIDHHMKIS
jgi:ribosomal-protein-alanine N-acetyltransferase